MLTPARVRCTGEEVTSALGRAQGQPGDELLLQHEEHDQHRERHQHRPRREQVVVGEELPAQVVERTGDRELVALPTEEHGRPEELVVDPGDLERGQRRKGRTDQGHGELPVLTPHAGAVDLGLLVDLVRQRLHVVAEHEGAEAHLEGDVDRDQPPVAAEHGPRVAHEERQRDLPEHPEDRDQQGLRRQQVGGEEDRQQGEVEAVAEARQHERDHRGQEQRQEHGRHRDDQRVEEVLPEAGVLPDVAVVVEGPAAEGEVAVLLGVGVARGRSSAPPRSAGRARAAASTAMSTVAIVPRGWLSAPPSRFGGASPLGGRGASTALMSSSPP